MVAKINRGASLYGAIIYNQQKVNEDTARIIAGNRMITDSLYDPDRIVQQTMFAFESYLAANRNTEKPILHISLNPTLDDSLTDSQFADLARAYMQKMGYGNQPYIVYLHEDIDRRHIHIVSTCVNENGEKIDDAYEWNRSMKACRELEQMFRLKPTAEELKLLIESIDKKLTNKTPIYGTTALIETPANGYKDTTVKFGKTFSKAPFVLLTLSGGSQNTKTFAAQVKDVSTTGMTIRTVNGYSSSVSMFINWCAFPKGA